MIKNQWYAVMASKRVKKGKVVGAKRFGENLVFFRDNKGTLACVTAVCPHRRASLAKGCVKNGNIQCPFHGIEYDVYGKCVHIPSNGRASQANNHRLDLKYYPTREIGGIIFAWYGDLEPDAEPPVFDVMTDAGFSYGHIEDLWLVDYSRVIENQLDVTHLAFVHHNTIGRGNKTLSNGPKVEWIDDRTLRTSADNEVDSGQKPKTAEESLIKSTNLTFKFPNIWLNHVSDKLMILACFVPIDDEKSIIMLRFYNRFTGVKPLDKLIALMGNVANKVVERQDKRIVETQRPKKSGLKINERLVAGDRPIVEYRKKRAELQNDDAPE